MAVEDPAPSTPGVRRIAVDGTDDLRDVGGLPAHGGTTRWRTLLRAGSLAGVTPAGRAALAALGVRTVVDLREPIERRRAPDALDGLGALVRAVPLFAARVDVSAIHDRRALYRAALETCGVGFAEAVAALCRPRSLPAVVHSTAGRDRSGLVTGLVLSAVGVGDDDIAEDHGRAAGPGEASRGPMLEALTLLRERHGGAAAYLRAHGLEAGQLDDLRRALVTPARG